MINSFCISEEASKYIEMESNQWHPLETGGILVGQFENSIAVVDNAIGPGRVAQHDERNFKRDGDYSQTKLDQMVRLSNGTFDYIGEWHSHPREAPPSSVDFRSMQWVANNRDYGIANPLLIICTFVNQKWVLNCFVYALGRLVKLPQTKARSTTKDPPLTSSTT